MRFARMTTLRLASSSERLLTKMPLPLPVISQFSTVRSSTTIA
jgi:hypothetical protein